MVAAGLQMLGIGLCVLGWIGDIVSCALPLWRVTAFVGSSIVTAQVTWEGLWMTCVAQSTGQIQCKIYDSMLALSHDLQASRALVVVSVLLGVGGLLGSVVGGKCTNCMEQGPAKARIMLAAGVLFIAAGTLSLVATSWTAHRVIQDFYSPLVAQSRKRELGAALFIAWASAALFLVGGGLLCCSCPKRKEGEVGRYTLATDSNERTGYV
ncbi:hypothetical protein SKAU_G00251480 [Synaphobranchus kaupii]|uniref:Claudin n=1 Tax=Synaphobranchus kaupii TaxID=118154 RepID=A0A9Q1IRN2_SYNKA|nr:hypothetical protein SKAU_G00251480 [Synaphobranchus kaupii]